MRRTRLRPVSRKRRQGRASFAAVYAAVDDRSQGWCEIEVLPFHRATEHHHLFKPRASFHAARFILHVCRAHHREFEAPYTQGRRVPTLYSEATGKYGTRVVFASDKFAARRVADLLATLTKPGTGNGAQ